MTERRKVWIAIDQMGVGGVGRSLARWLPEMAAIADVTVVSQMTEDGIFREAFAKHAEIFHPRDDAHLLRRLREDRPAAFVNNLVGGYVPLTPEIRKHVPWLSCILHTADLWSLSMVAPEIAPLYDAVSVVAEGQASIVQGHCQVPVRCVENIIALPAYEAVSKDALRASLGLPAGAFLFGYVGRPSPDKGLEHAAPIVARLVALGVDAHFVFVGASEQGLGAITDRRGIEDSRVKTSFAKLGIRNRLHVYGAREDVGAFYQAMDATLLLSQHEGAPLMPWESLWFGTPFIATAVGDIPDWFDPDIGSVLLAGSLDLVSDTTEALVQIHQRKPRTIAKYRTAGKSLCQKHKGIDQWRQRYGANLAILLGVANT